jgi:hypothetical protein|nr:MAG TPA: YopX protein [Caudoviricetes sp.]
MIPKFRAYDSSSYTRMYQPDEVMVGNGDIWIIDEDSCDNEWIVNNDLHLMQSTGVFDDECREIFEGDILGVESDEGTLNVNVFWDEEHALFMFESKQHNEKEALAELLEDNSYPFEIIGNIYENPELLEVKE